MVTILREPHPLSASGGTSLSDMISAGKVTGVDYRAQYRQQRKNLYTKHDQEAHNLTRLSEAADKAAVAEGRLKFGGDSTEDELEDREYTLFTQLDSQRKEKAQRDNYMAEHPLTARKADELAATPGAAAALATNQTVDTSDISTRTRNGIQSVGLRILDIAGMRQRGVDNPLIAYLATAAAAYGGYKLLTRKS